jgi:hypothetical protein
MASEEPKMCKQGAAGKRNHVTIMIPQKVEIIRPESHKSQIVVMASYNTGLSTVRVLKKQMGHL